MICVTGARRICDKLETKTRTRVASPLPGAPRLLPRDEPVEAVFPSVSEPLINCNVTPRALSYHGMQFSTHVKPVRSYVSHLAVGEISLLPGGEWMPRFPGWSLILVGSGSGYWLHKESNQEVQPGTVLVITAHARGSIRASQLGGLSLFFFPVQPERLTGLITLNEQRVFETAASRKELSLQILAPDTPVASRMRNLYAGVTRTGPAFRLQLLQLFIEVFGSELTREMPGAEPASDARERLWKFLNQTPASELLHVSFSELVQMARCTPRHLSRVFHELVGMSFREKHAELRLARACELLATTESKVVDVALESGYQSLSLFNLMFTRRFGMSPGKWRRKHQTAKVPGLSAA